MPFCKRNLAEPESIFPCKNTVQGASQTSKARIDPQESPPLTCSSQSPSQEVADPSFSRSETLEKSMSLLFLLLTFALSANPGHGQNLTPPPCIHCHLPGPGHHYLLMSARTSSPSPCIHLCPANSLFSSQ